MWLDNLKELKKKTGMSSKQIADMTNLPERTVVRIFSGDTDNPYMDTLRRIVAVLGGSLDDIFVESKMMVTNTDLITMQSEVERLNSETTVLQEEIERLKTEAMLLEAEIVVLKDKNASLSAENDLLRLKLEYEEKIVALHNYYMKRSSDNHDI